jgi:DNA-binding PadR family transcriptional regulator
MPAKKPTPATMPSEDLVLAAIDRAFRHRTNQRNPGVLLVDVKEHLGLDRSGASTVRLRPTWQNLQTLGLVEQTHQSNRILWRLTDTGHTRLQAARQTSELSLPESPQHRRWREAHTIASRRIDTLRDELRAALADATRLMDNNPQADSNAWYELGEHVQTASRRLGSATHCLHEWHEPDDATADIDTPPPLRAGRRDYRSWAEAS